MNGIKYLGINITSPATKILSLNGGVILYAVMYLRLHTQFLLFLLSFLADSSKRYIPSSLISFGTKRNPNISALVWTGSDLFEGNFVMRRCITLVLTDLCCPDVDAHWAFLHFVPHLHWNRRQFWKTVNVCFKSSNQTIS